MVAVFAAGTVVIALLTPSGFLPNEDQGAYFTQINLPPGASLNRTTAFTDKAAAIFRQQPQVKETVEIIGFSLLDAATESNAAFIITELQPFGKRSGARNGAEAVIDRVNQATEKIRDGTSTAFNLPPIIGLSTNGGFQYELENVAGADPDAIERGAERAAGRRRPEQNLSESL